MKRIDSRPRGIAARRLYWVWAAMIQRCHNRANAGYVRYGAKGVKVCEAWRQSFDTFFSDMGLPLPGMMLERKNSLGDYEPANCVWATRQQQNENRPSFNWALEIENQPVNLRQAWEKYSSPGVSYRSVIKRIIRGWPVSIAIVLPHARGEAR